MARARLDLVGRFERFDRVAKPALFRELLALRLQRFAVIRVREAAVPPSPEPRR